MFKSLVRFNRLILRSSPLPVIGRETLLRLSQYKESRIVCPLSCHTEIEVGKGFPSMLVLALPSPSSTACALHSLRFKTTNGGFEPRLSGMPTKRKFPNAYPYFGKGELEQ